MQNEIVIPKKQNALSRALDKLFHFTDRGSTLGSEIGAGFSAFFIAVCALIMNTRIIGAAYGNYAGSYLAVTAICFVGTLLLGVLCNLPLVQTGHMGLASVLITMLGTDSGLTYANLMLVTFASALVYLLVVLTPAKKILVDALPDGVKKALPAGIGLYTIIMALKNSGLVTAAGTAASAGDFTTLFTYYFWLMVAAIPVFVLLKASGRKKPYIATFGILIGAMWIGGILFYMEHFLGGQTAAVVVYERLNLVFATDGASPYNLGLGISSLKIGELFTQGLDFSAFQAKGGNVILLFAQGILTFLLLGLYTDLGTLKATAEVGGYEAEEKAERNAMAVSAAVNVVGPVLGASPTTIGAQSAVGSGDGGKTGITSLTAAFGYLIALFSWIFIMFFATGTNGVGMWINDSEIKLAAYVLDTFAFADLIMVFAGAAMLKSLVKLDLADTEALICAVSTVICMALMGSIALGAAVGTVLCLVVRVAKKELGKIALPQILAGAISLVFVLLTLI